ncbi:efflux RND transporter periplasmic adaptor subunit [Thermoflexibacter ruber]|uniref:RND family efflux transporter, MFP subunit n=1 Tax=Thermoflexibacter ruber TaxID=1003 RepID=A0A1I2FFI0_9BACT|nr:efflux RND transporter periplasmic adaptor subunit [Thermoflexibacter ruber]SFF03517.1 RND family efflux transporter, MFP subunit [Thermoflexibacter ruber]
MKKVIIALVIIGAIGLTAWKLSENKKAVEEKVYRRDPNTQVLVKTAKVTLQELNQVQTWLGTFEPNREIKILSETNGKVVKVGISEGERVSAGQLIAQVDSDILQYQILAAEANYQEAQADVRRYQNLTKEEAVAKIQLEKANLSAKAAESQLKVLQKQLKNTTIVAPFSGTITSKTFDLGTVLAMGTPLAQLTDISAVKLVINVPEKDILKFKEGQSVNVTTDVFPNQQFAGKVTMISAKSDNAHNYPVQILVNNSSTNLLRAGMYGSVVIDNSLKTNALVIPRNALVGTVKQPQVFVVENGKAVLKNIQIGTSSNDFYEVTEGLKEGEIVIISGQVNLENGTLVKE